MNLNKLSTFIMANIHTLLFLIGLGVFIYAAFRTQPLFGYYVLAGSLMLVGVMADGRPRGGR